MAQYTTYMPYIVFFNDEAEYNFAISVAGSNLLQMNPRDAGSMFSIPYPYPSGEMIDIPKGIYFTFPFTPGQEYTHPGPSGIFVDDSVDSQLVPGQAGNPPTVWPTPGPDCLFVWYGVIMLNQAAGTSASPSTTAIPQRRWIEGFEPKPHIAGGTQFTNNQLGRMASRTVGGFGMVCRGNNLSSYLSKSVSLFRAGLTPTTSWERFYIRVRAWPTTVDMGAWRSIGAASGAGCGVVVSMGEYLDVVSITGAGVLTSKGTIAITLGEWTRIDVLMKFDMGALTTGKVIAYVNGLPAVTWTQADGTGMNSCSSHSSSRIGLWTSLGAEAVGEFDLDDWMCADVPDNYTSDLDDTGDPPSLDWMVGSHIRQQFSTAVSVTNWTPAGVESLNQGVSPETALSSAMVSTTSGAVIEGTTDVPLMADMMDTPATVIGPVAATVGVYHSNAAGTDGEIGYNPAGAGYTMTTTNQAALAAYHSVAYLPSGLFEPEEFNPFLIKKTKSADANSDSTYALQAAVEYIGAWGPEDNADYEYNRDWYHNCRYENTVWAYFGPVAAAPCYAVGGTYTGNGTSQEVELPAPAHFLWIRATTGAAPAGIRWFAASTEGHNGGADRCIPNFRIWTDSDGVCKFSVCGNGAGQNQNAIVYQYVAFCDPGMRFNYCGNYALDPTGLPRILDFQDPEFTPEFAFAQRDLVGTVSAVIGCWVKGAGHTGSAGSTIAGAAITNFGTFTQGTFTPDTSIVDSGNVNNYSMWRTTEPGCAGVMVQIGTYVGDGSNPRTINITPVSGRYPLLAFVFPSSVAGTAIARDASHTGTNSCTPDTQLNQTTGIIGFPAVDQIQVQTLCNVNGVTYTYFIIPGDSAGVNNGIFYNPMCEPPDGGRDTPTVAPEGDINVIPEGGLILGDIPGGGTAITMLQDVSGIYTLVDGKHNDTLMDRQAGQEEIDVKIPNPLFKTGYYGG